MTRRALAMSVALVLYGSVASSAAEPCRDPVTEGEAVAAEDARYRAMMQADVAELEKLLGDDLVYTHSSGAVDAKPAYVEAIRTGTVQYKTMKRSDVKVRTYGCAAVMTGRADFLVGSKGQDSPSNLRFTSVWVKRDGALQFVSWQSTRLPAP